MWKNMFMKLYSLVHDTDRMHMVWWDCST
jgi:hypothetical protein